MAMKNRHMENCQNIDKSKNDIVSFTEMVLRGVNMDEFKDLLAKQIKDSGMNQKQLAEKSGVTEAAISRYLHGTRKPNMSALVMLKKAFGCKWEELIGV